MGCSPNVLFFSLLFICAAWKLAGFCKCPWMISRYSHNHFQAPQLLKTLLFTCRNQTCAIAVAVSQACEPNHLQNLTVPALPESDAKVGQHTGASHPDPICSPLAPEIPPSAEGWPSPEETPLSSPILTSVNFSVSTYVWMPRPSLTTRYVYTCTCSQRLKPCSWRSSFYLKNHSEIAMPQLSQCSSTSPSPSPHKKTTLGGSRKETGRQFVTSCPCPALNPRKVTLLQDTGAKIVGGVPRQQPHLPSTGVTARSPLYSPRHFYTKNSTDVYWLEFCVSQLSQIPRWPMWCCIADKKLLHVSCYLIGATVLSGKESTC